MVFRQASTMLAWCLLLPVIAPKNSIGEKTLDELRKYIPLLKLPEFGLQRAAVWLQDWADGTLQQAPLFDVGMLLGNSKSSVLPEVRLERIDA